MKRTQQQQQHPAVGKYLGHRKNSTSTAAATQMLPATIPLIRHSRRVMSTSLFLGGDFTPSRTELK